MYKKAESGRPPRRERPRRFKASTVCGSGTKYAIVMWIVLSAWAIAETSARKIAGGSPGPLATTRTGCSPCALRAAETSCAARAGHLSARRPGLEEQALEPGDRRPVDAHGHVAPAPTSPFCPERDDWPDDNPPDPEAAPPERPDAEDPGDDPLGSTSLILMPPSNATLPSTITSFLWLRLLTRHPERALSGFTGLYSSTFTPASRSRWKYWAVYKSSYGVVDEIDRDALRTVGEQEIREPVARLALLDHVELDVHVIARAFRSRRTSPCRLRDRPEAKSPRYRQ